MMKDNNQKDPKAVRQSQVLFIIVFVSALASLVLYQGRTGPILETATSTRVTLQADYPSVITTDNANNNPLAIPVGEAQALPSIRVAEDEVSRKIYGGKGDKAHLGGFTLYDGQGVSPATWKYMLEYFGVKKVLDVGCGKGVSTLWFHLHGAEVLCLEGSHDGVTNTLLPDPENQVVEHDFSRGPYWPAKTYDAVWCVEFLEHVGRNYQYNYIQAFRKSALIFASHSQWGGWHHVEVHDNDWWIERMESFGFKYSARLTKMVHDVATKERGTGVGPDGKPFNAQHVWLNMQVFVNPVVASLPEHAHLFAEHGCFKSREEGTGRIIHQECGKRKEEMPMPKSFQPLELTPEQDEAWLERIKEHIGAHQQPEEAPTA